MSALKRRDLLWAFAYPLYQLLGSFRHEASHALVAMLQGARITEFVFWPTPGYWGYVSWEGQTTWVALAAPYICDLLTFVVCFYVCMRVRFAHRWLWLNLMIVGSISPLVNSVFNYNGRTSALNDVGALLGHLPPAIVHGYFWFTMVTYATGAILVVAMSEFAQDNGQTACESDTMGLEQ